VCVNYRHTGMSAYI